ncbi:MAG: tryptophan synthase subunit alpha [Spirochaetales bacterium]|nr:tryptophan synthase subunit alpha [Spirochaetales bacterium]
MTHMIAGYPNAGTDFEVARGLIDGGAGFLEVQFPFSDPSADGLPIQAACMAALNAGFRVKNGFELIKRIKSISDIPVFVMSYASVVYAKGVRPFVREAGRCGVEGLIIPDLMPGYDEGLFQIGAAEGVHIVPVVPPALSEARLSEILAQNPAYLYAALRVGITGSRTEIDETVFSSLARLRGTGKQVFAGFGIETRAQVISLAVHADVLIVGSEIVRAIAEAVKDGKQVYESVKRKVRSLLEDGATVETEKTE